MIYGKKNKKVKQDDGIQRLIVEWISSNGSRHCRDLKTNESIVFNPMEEIFEQVGEIIELDSSGYCNEEIEGDLLMLEKDPIRS